MTIFRNVYDFLIYSTILKSSTCLDHSKLIFNCIHKSQIVALKQNLIKWYIGQTKLFIPQDNAHAQVKRIILNQQVSILGKESF